MSKRHRFVLCSLGLGLGLVLVPSCSPSSGSTDPNALGGKGKTGNAGAANGSDASQGTGNENGTGASGGGIVFGSDASRRGPGDGALTSDSACGKSVMKP